MELIKRLWRKAEKLNRDKRFTMNYPNIYVQYLYLTGLENERKGFLYWIKRLFHKKVEINPFYADAESIIVDSNRETKKIEDYIAKVKAEFEKMNISNPDRRTLVLEAIEKAMTIAAGDKVKSKKDLKEYGTLIEKKSSESDVYVDEKRNVVLKSKDIFAHDAHRPHNPWDTFYEHIAINLLFQNVPLHFCGFSTRDGHPSLLFEQEYFRDMREAKDEEIEAYLNKLGFKRENKYCFGNDWIGISDVFGNNVLSDDKGMLYFIDPNIYFKKPACDVICYFANHYTCKK